MKVDIWMFLEWENNSGKFQSRGKFQNNAINDVKFHWAMWTHDVISWVVSTSNHMFDREICDKFPEY